MDNADQDNFARVPVQRYQLDYSAADIEEHVTVLLVHTTIASDTCHARCVLSARNNALRKLMYYMSVENEELRAVCFVTF
jgi:hypothetical protein